MTRYDMAATLSPPSSFNICINRKPSKDKLNDIYLNMPFITQTHGSQNNLHFSTVFTCADCRNM